MSLRLPVEISWCPDDSITSALDSNGNILYPYVRIYRSTHESYGYNLISTDVEISTNQHPVEFVQDELCRDISFNKDFDIDAYLQGLTYTDAKSVLLTLGSQEPEKVELFAIKDENNNYLINDRHQADYFINLSKQCEQDIEQIKQFIAEERLRLMQQLDAFESREIASKMHQKAYYDRALEDFTRRELANSNKKSIKLPSGTLAIKKQQPHYDYTDETLLEWAKDFAPDLVKTTYVEPKVSIDKKELKKKAKEYKHMTFYEAAQLAKDANVKELWLTHYSPSLTYPEEYVEDARKIFENTIAAKDGRTMEINYDE